MKIYVVETCDGCDEGRHVHGVFFSKIEACNELTKIIDKYQGLPVFGRILEFEEGKVEEETEVFCFNRTKESERHKKLSSSRISDND